MHPQTAFTVVQESLQLLLNVWAERYQSTLAELGLPDDKELVPLQARMDALKQALEPEQCSDPIP